MNTSEFIPYDVVARNILVSKENPDFPGTSGTGFFVKFPPFLDIFYVTARHCIVDNDNKGDKSGLRVLVSSSEGKDQLVDFDKIVEFSPAEGQDLEDVIIYHVNNLDDKKGILSKRALELWHQDDVDDLLNNAVEREERLRAVGFPGVNVSINYELETPVLMATVRGFHGIARKAEIDGYYSITDTNWKEVYDGFSGSPILYLANKRVSVGKPLKEDVAIIPVGILLLGSTSKGIHFLNINAITDAIAGFLLKEGASS